MGPLVPLSKLLDYAQFSFFTSFSFLLSSQSNIFSEPIRTLIFKTRDVPGSEMLGQDSWLRLHICSSASCCVSQKVRNFALASHLRVDLVPGKRRNDIQNKRHFPAPFFHMRYGTIWSATFQRVWKTSDEMGISNPAESGWSYIWTYIYWLGTDWQLRLRIFFQPSS